MISIDLDELVKVINGTLLSEVESQAMGLATDTRHPMQGQLFIALRGDQFDAHDFLSKTIEQGAHIVVVDKKEKAQGLLGYVSVVEVSDTLVALQKLSTYWRLKGKFQVVGLTGSNGKTTTKEFAATLLSKKWRVSYTKGSLNNHWGVPMSLLKANLEDEVVVLEMGMNHLGEIQHLCEIAHPDVVLVTNVGRAHVGELGSVEAIAKAKEEIYNYSKSTKKVFNLDSPRVLNMYERHRGEGESWTFSSINQEADVSFQLKHMSLESLVFCGRIQGQSFQEVTVPIFGAQNLSNLMAASGVALACGVEPEKILQGLKDCKTIWGRNQLLRLDSGTQILFDAYNANPDSMESLFQNMDQVAVAGEKWAIVGEMLELGAQAEILHFELGQKMKEQDWQGLWFIGPSKEAFLKGIKGAKFEKTLYFSDTYEETLASQVKSMLNPTDIVVIKGSRGNKLERVVQAWQPGLL